MKKFGLIGGTSWHSTVEYYATINRLVNAEHGDNTNPPLRIVSLNQKEIHDLQRSDDWGAIANILVDAALELQMIGVEGIALCANTPHKVFDRLQTALTVPVLHIADAIGVDLARRGLNKVGLVGTRFTMAEDFITGPLRERHRVETLVPAAPVQGEIQGIIYDKLSVGVFDDAAREYFLQVIDSLSTQGAQAVILGCTEIPLLLEGVPCALPPIDSLNCHCEAIVRYILGEANPGHGI
jgi:aspartate racemase